MKSILTHCQPYRFVLGGEMLGSDLVVRLCGGHVAVDLGVTPVNGVMRKVHPSRGWSLLVMGRHFFPIWLVDLSSVLEALDHQRVKMVLWM